MENVVSRRQTWGRDAPSDAAEIQVMVRCQGNRVIGASVQEGQLYLIRISPMAAPGRPDIRGERREELVQDLARGDLTHTQLAEKYDRHVQAIAQFAVRNKAEIAVIQAGHNKALHERLAAIPIADQARRIAVNGLLRDDLLAQLEDQNLPLVDRNRLTKTAAALNRAVAEELGDLRTRLDVAVQKNVLDDYREFVIGDDGTFHPLAGSNVDGPTSEGAE
jgi:hypothetical protein